MYNKLVLDNNNYKLLLGKFGVKSIFSQNSKMKSSSKDNVKLVNFGIVAYKSANGTLTCPNAKNCISGCYARQGAYCFGPAKRVHESKFQLSQSEIFVSLVVTEIKQLLDKNKNKALLIRIHDSGDFYSQEYLEKWLTIMHLFQNEPRVLFYAYTKMILMFRSNEYLMPSNFCYIFSYGGKQDNLIRPDIDRHSKVFQSETELNNAGYFNTLDDFYAIVYQKLGLVYHGTKNYSNTNWQLP